MIDQTAQRVMQVPGQGIIPRGRPTIDYKEYPKMMTHPQFQPGKPSAEVKSPHGFTYHGIGTPVRFPPVLVKTPDDEAYHASLGYEGAVKCDPAAFDRAVGNGQIPDQVVYKAIEYPKWVLGKLVHSKEEEDKLTGAQAAPAVLELETEVKTLLDRPDINRDPPGVHELVAPTKTIEQLRIEDLEAKVDHLTMLLATALKEQNRPSAPTRDDIEHGYTLAKKVLAKLPTPKKAKNIRKPVVRTAQQKKDHAEAIKAGLARKRALAESEPTEQGDAAPVQ